MFQTLEHKPVNFSTWRESFFSLKKKLFSTPQVDFLRFAQCCAHFANNLPIVSIFCGRLFRFCLSWTRFYCRLRRTTGSGWGVSAISCNSPAVSLHRRGFNCCARRFGRGLDWLRVLRRRSRCNGRGRVHRFLRLAFRARSPLRVTSGNRGWNWRGGGRSAFADGRRWRTAMKKRAVAGPSFARSRRKNRKASNSFHISEPARCCDNDDCAKFRKCLSQHTWHDSLCLMQADY